MVVMKNPASDDRCGGRLDRRLGFQVPGLMDFGAQAGAGIVTTETSDDENLPILKCPSIHALTVSAPVLVRGCAKVAITPQQCGQTLSLGQSTSHFAGTPSGPGDYPTMARFFFHLHNGDGLTEDRDGSDHDGLDAAIKVATVGLREVIAEEVKAGSIFTSSYIDVCNRDQQSLEQVHFHDVVNFRN